VVVLTGGGLAASFLARPSGAAAVASMSAASAPTIMAVEGPSKVQPDNSADAAQAAADSSTLLDKNNKGDGTATAKVVNTTEQPVDLAQAVKPAGAAAQPADDPRPPQPLSPFPEPKKVKTVMVRPDGTIITDPADSMAASSRLALATGSGSDLAFDPKTALPLPAPQDQQPAAAAAPAAPVPAKSTPAKVTARAATTPKEAAQATDPAPAGSIPAEVPSAKPKPATPARPPKAKPVELASANADAPVAAGSGGGYAVQIGAPPSEQEARDASSRFQKKFAAQLGSYRPAIRKADVGDKSVYRIRVGNLSQEEAKSLCSKLQSGGGGCFVVRN
jgi:hypothetical protein